MFAATYGMSINDLEAQLVRVEVDVANGLPGFDIVGMPTTAVKEARDRVRSAIRNSGYQFPLQRITVNLAPADFRKESSSLDLPIAIGILTATNQLPAQVVKGKVFCGELSLEGVLRPIKGILSMAMAIDRINTSKRSDFPEKQLKLVCPTDNLLEARLVNELKSEGSNHLQFLVEALQGFMTWDIVPEPCVINDNELNQIVDFSDIKGQYHAKRALIIAAAGGHNLLLIGPPGSGKTLLARAYAGILPSLTKKESLEVSQLYSIAGNLPSGTLITQPPFRAPHHSTTMAGILGGGRDIKPGELALANHGVLFMDELPEFPRQVLESLRQPLEDREFTVTRLKGSIKYPAHVSVIASMNPCPCGFYGDKGRVCSCTPRQIDQYRNRISGPVLDRIDMHVEVPRLSFEELHGANVSEGTMVIKDKVSKAREIQAKRLGNGRTNASMTAKETAEYCSVSNQAESILKRVFDKNLLSARAHDRILRLAQTIADLEELQSIEARHIAEAVQLRVLDKGL